MLTRTKAAMLASALLWPTVAMAQKQIHWSQTLNLPKGLNLPGGIKADILGVELGDTYADAKPKLEKLAAEAGARIQESTTVLRLGSSPAIAIEAAFVGRIVADRELPGSTQKKIRDQIEAHFSAPSSGHQLLSVVRRIMYPAQSDQPRISELLTALREKFKTQGQLDGGTFVIRYAKGQPKGPAQHGSIACNGALWANPNFVEIPMINPKGECDVGLVVTFSPGISGDHAASIQFTLVDNERAKAALMADFAFFDDYVKKLQAQPGGAAPKL